MFTHTRAPRHRGGPGRHTVGRLLEVDIGVSEGSAGDHVPADPDREDGSGGAEFLVQHGLRHVRVEVPDVQGGHGVAGGTGVHPGRARTLPRGATVATFRPG